MSEHDPHERVADAAEHDLDELQEQSDRLGEDIEQTREDWRAKQADPQVPGADGGPSTTPDEVDPEAAAREDDAGED
jgi:hypothetical protein